MWPTMEHEYNVGLQAHEINRYSFRYHNVPYEFLPTPCASIVFANGGVCSSFLCTAKPPADLKFPECL